MYPNPLKQKLQRGDLVLGTSLSAPTPLVTAILCKTGVDFIWIDTEHQAWATETIETLPVQMRHAGVAPMIRVANPCDGFIRDECRYGKRTATPRWQRDPKREQSPLA